MKSWRLTSTAGGDTLHTHPSDCGDGRMAAMCDRSVGAHLDTCSLRRMLARVARGMGGGVLRWQVACAHS